MGVEYPPTFEDKDKLDPEPLAIVTLCMGGAMLVNAVANTFINYRKYLRDEDHRHEDSEAEFLSKADVLRTAGERLLHVIRIMGENGDTAFRLIGPRSKFIAEEEELNNKGALTECARSKDYSNYRTVECQCRVL